MKVLAALREMLPAATVRQLYRSYLDSLANTGDAIQASLDAQDARQLSEAAHGVKGAAANLGLSAVARAAQAVESRVKLLPATPSDADWAELNALSLALQAELTHSAKLCQQHQLV